MTKMWKEIFQQPEALKSCIETNERAVREIADALNEADISSVVIAARGTSDHAAVYGKYIIEYKLGIPVALAAPSIFTAYKGTLKMKNCLVAAISQSGEAEDVLEVIKAANSQGAITLGITNFVDSPIAKECRFHLFTNAGVEQSVAATKTFTTQLASIAQLVAHWSGDENLAKMLKTIPENVSKVLCQKEAVITKVQRYRYMEECFVLARGINYSISLEAALKIQETNYVRAKGYATSDFHHGPFAMVEKDMPVIVFAPEGPSLKDVKEMTDKLISVGAEVIIVSNNDEICEMGNVSFKIPKTENDMISPFYNVVLAQMFACQLSLAKGLDPDRPRGLNKVTITR